MKKKREIDKEIGKRLKRFVAENEIKQEELAEICGKRQATVSSWIRGRTTPSAEDIKHICLKYKVKADYLLGIE